MEQFPFNPRRAIAAAALLLRQHRSHECSYLRMLKLLYIADRECLEQTGKPVMGGEQVVMDNGPLHSRVYSMVKGEDICSAEWQKHIQRDGYRISLIHDPGVESLTRFEVRKLCEVVQRYQDTDDWELVAITHKFREVEKNKPSPGSRTVLPLEDVLDALGLGDKADEITQEARSATRIAKTLKGG